MWQSRRVGRVCTVALANTQSTTRVCQVFSNYTVVPEIALAKLREDAPFDKVCYIGCGVTTGIGAVLITAKVEAGENVVDRIVQLTDGGADDSFECIGNTKIMRLALECTHKGWRRSIIIGVAEAGAGISTRPFQLVTDRKWEGSAFGGARGRSDVPRIVDWYMQGKINIDDLITHSMPLEDINRGFDLMKRGESICGVVLY